MVVIRDKLDSVVSAPGSDTARKAPSSRRTPNLASTSPSLLVCAVDLGGTNLRAATIDHDGKIHDRARCPTPRTSDASEIVSAIASVVSECGNQAALSNSQIKTVSVVVPGSVHAVTGLVVNAPNVPAIVGFDLLGALSDKLHLSVLLENDANAAAVGEMWRGAARGCQTVVCFTLGTGVGSGVILNGELWRGIDGTGGEIGHTSVNPFGGVPCKCGSLGCLEVYASATAIVRMARELLLEYPASTLHAIAGVDLSAKEIAAAADANDECALVVFEKMATHLGVGIANVVNALNPEAIVIGGGVSAAFDLFAPRARAEMMKRAFPVPAQRCQILKAECGDDAGLLGAAWLAFQRKQEAV
jgi:glucokinase